MKPQLLLAVVLAAACAHADKVVLKSGSVITGTAGLIQDGNLLFKSEELGDLKIKIDNIISLDKTGTHVVQYKDNTCQDKVLTIKNGVLVEDKGQKLDMTKVKATDPKVETWHGTVNLGYQAARGNTYQNNGSVLANLNRRWEQDRVNIDFGYYYGESGQAGKESQKTTDRWEAEVKHDHFWWEKVYHYEDLRYDRDVIQELDARYRVGLGGGYQWLDNQAFESTGKWNFNQELGVNWIKEEYENNDDAKDGGFCALRYAHHLGYIPKWYDNVEIFHNFEILPEVDEWEKFLAKGDFGFSTKLIMDFDLLCKIEWDYNSKPSANRKKDDLRYIVGLGYKW